MKLGLSSLKKLSEIVCGNAPFDYFPYRSSSVLSNFFTELDLDYIHDGSTRAHWVFSVLTELNDKPSKSANMPSVEIVKVIEQLLHPDYFVFEQNPNLHFGKAKEAVMQILKINSLKLADQPTGLVKVVPLAGEFISTGYSEVPTERLITFRPSVFEVPNKSQQDKLVSVMMPFNSGFSGTYEAIKKVTNYMNLDCKRADDIWDNSTILQDIFDLIFCAKVVVVDFSGRNSNVMYETGIAHALGKQIIPITQSINDIPSDIAHHRALVYLPNEEGYRKLSRDLHSKFKDIFVEQLQDN